MNDKHGVADKIDTLVKESLYISEITYAELLFGVEKSELKTKNIKLLTDFISELPIITISNVIPLFAKEKARLYKMGKPVSDFDLLICCTAVVNNLILLTNNTKHFINIQGIKLDDITT